MTKSTDWLVPLDSALYKKQNLEGWSRSSSYWVSSPLRHVVDNDAAIDAIIDRLVKDGQTIVEVGCGDGFLYRRIRAKRPNVRYVGLDFNKSFVEALSNQSADDDRATFQVFDLEQDIPAELVAKADVVFSFFVFLEIENLRKCFENCASLLRPGGVLSVFTIEYVFLILAVSRNFADFKANLGNYEGIREEGRVPYTFQKIDLGDGESEELTYGSVFHSTADFVMGGLNCGLSLGRFEEHIKTKKFHPKVYQYFEFLKPAE